MTDSNEIEMERHEIDSRVFLKPHYAYVPY